MAVTFSILGPVTMCTEGEPQSYGGGYSAAILAALLLKPGRVVPIDELIEAAWDDSPPSGARVQVQNRISALRRALGSAGPSPIHTVANGYRIEVPQGALDTARFVGHCAEAKRSTAASPDEAIAGFERALAEWRGPALHGLDSRYMRNAAELLEQRGADAAESLAALRIERGDPGAAIPELTRLTQAHPYRETAHELLMRALHRSGRAAEALDAYRAVRDTLADDLGTEPNEALQRLQAAILQCEPSAASPAAPERPVAVSTGPVVPTGAGAAFTAVPAQLPPSSASFVGRAEQLAWLDAAIGPVGSAEPARTVAITGPPGMGKSALAVHWGHRNAAAEFPEGQLYADLGDSGTPATAGRVLTRFLGELGVLAANIPASTEAKTAMYRSLLASHRMLVVLDNAVGSDQVRPLLPGTGGCLTLITSRNRLGGLLATEGARALPLGPLSTPESIELLSQRAGAARVGAEPAAATAIVEACGWLPLALAITGVRASMRPQLSLSAFVADLRAPGRSLAAFNGGDARTDLRAVFALSYDRLSGPAARMFRALGRCPGSHFDCDTAARLARTSVADATGALDELTHASLVQPQALGRYTMNVLLRTYAVQLTPVYSEFPVAG